MSRTDRIRRIIAREKRRGAIPIETFIRVKARENTAEEIADAIAYCYEIIEAVPRVLDRVRQVAAERGVSDTVEPLVAHAEDYFLEADDYFPERKFGALGLLDDAYVALRVVSSVQNPRHPLLELDLRGALDFLRQLLGDQAVAILDAEVEKARARLRAQVEELGELARRRAEAERASEPPRRPAEPPSTPSVRPSPAPEYRQCSGCAGSGRISCSSCCGYGYHVQSYSRVDLEGNVEHVTDQIPCSCSGGFITCGACGGAGWS